MAVGFEGLLTLLGLTLLAVPVAIVYLLISHARLKRRVAFLEDEARFGVVPKVPSAAEAMPDAPAVAKPDAETEPEVAQSEPVTTPDESPAADTPNPWAAARRSADAVATPETRAPEVSADVPPKAYVFKPGLATRLTTWVMENWVVAIAALSLALAGVFLVQYGAENGLLTPFWRVMSAVALGIGLILIGERIRRREGDGDSGAHAFLPSAFSGAGLIALFAAALAARQLYGLIGPEATFGALLATSLLAVALGWFYGPLLTIIGILGATTAPFLVGGSSDQPQIYFYYFALIAFAGLLVDAMRRWAWVSVFALIFTHLAAGLIFFADAGDVHYLAFGLMTMMGAVTLPMLRWWPMHEGSMVSQALVSNWREGKWPEFPTRVAAGAFAGVCGITALVTMKDGGLAEAWAVVATLCALFIATTIWFNRAPALSDLAALPPIGMICFLLWQGDTDASIARAFHAERLPESAPPWDISIFTAIALVGALLAFWRSQSAPRFTMIWAGGAAVLAPAMLGTLEIFWQPSRILGANYWGLHVLAAAALMTLFCERAARADAPDKRRASVFLLSALSLIGFALMVMLGEIALTLALAAMVVLAALIDRWQNMPAMGWFMQAAAAVIAFRLIIEPGLPWAEGAPLPALFLGYGGTLALLAAGWLILLPLQRVAAKVVLESAIWTLGAVFVSLLLFRVLGAEPDSHWGMALYGMVWVAAMGGQLYRAQIGGVLKWVRRGLASIFGLIGIGALAIAAVGFNPVLNRYETVQGPLVFDSLLVAYLLPAMMLGVLAMKLSHVHRLLRICFAALGGALGALYVACEIRRFWRGDVLAVPGTTQPELYSYTVAMLILSVALLFFAFARRSVTLRRVAMLGIALTIAKVFLIDMSGLTGLVRVASFLGLGLALAGLAWLNQRMTEEWGETEPDAEDRPPEPTED